MSLLSVPPLLELVAVGTGLIAAISSLVTAVRIHNSKRLIMGLAMKNRGLQKALVARYADKHFDQKEMVDLQEKILLRMANLHAEKRVSAFELRGTKMLMNRVVHNQNENFFEELALMADKILNKDKPVEEPS